MLERAVQELKEGGEELPEIRTTINLGVDLMIPGDYVADEHHRLMVYRRIATATSREDLDHIRDEMEDRYGKLPRQGHNLLATANLRLMCETLRVQQLDCRSGMMTVRFSDTSPVDPERLLGWVSRRRDATFSPPGILRIRVDKGHHAEAERLALAGEVLTSLA